MKKRILSGMRPTGKLHLGHLAGALKNWVEMQEKYDCFYMVADYHALMSEYADPSAMKENIIDNTADFLACGLDPAGVLAPADAARLPQLAVAGAVIGVAAPGLGLRSAP